MNEATPNTRELARGLLLTMRRIREFETSLYRLFMAGELGGTMHQAIGQEAVAAGVGAALRPDDRMASTHRGHGHAIAQGLPLDALMAEMYGCVNGCSSGMGGSMHMFDAARGFLGTTGVVGAGVPIAVGAALASALEASDRATVTFFGDGASNQGAVHEALNLAAAWGLGVVFVCENNGYAVSMSASDALAVSGVVARAPGYGMPGVSVDGQDVMAVHAAAVEAVDRARRGEGPSLIECRTYRYKGHSRFEPARYRPKEELERWQARDPIELFEQHCRAEGLLSEAAIEAMRRDVVAEVAAAVEAARSSTPADAAMARELVFAP